MLDDVAPSATAVANPGDVVGVVARVRVSTGTGVTACLRIGLRVRVERRVDRACVMRAIKRTAMVLAALAVLMSVGVSRPSAAWAGADGAISPACAASVVAPAGAGDITTVQDASARGPSGAPAAAVVSAPPEPLTVVASVAPRRPDGTRGRCPRPPAREHPVWPD